MVSLCADNPASFNFYYDSINTTTCRDGKTKVSSFNVMGNITANFASSGSHIITRL